ncbi:MAG TPA: hypothetical protein DG942_05435 [Ruminococcaceae bacterium]|nr:hypothetical protein [Oscillospiraceae bacterium]
MGSVAYYKRNITKTQETSRHNEKRKEEILPYIQNSCHEGLSINILLRGIIAANLMPLKIYGGKLFIPQNIFKL